MDTLIQFQGDDTTKLALLDFLYSYIDQEGLRRMYEGEDVSHIKDAKDLIDGAFTKLKQDYGVNQSNERTNINQAE